MCTVFFYSVKLFYNRKKKEITASGYIDQLPAGVILTGGASQLKGVAQKAQDIMGLAARTGSPVHIDGINEIKNPAFATGTGMIKLAAKGNLNHFTSKEKGNTL